MAGKTAALTGSFFLQALNGCERKTHRRIQTDIEQIQEGLFGRECTRCPPAVLQNIVLQYPFTALGIYIWE